MGSIFETIPLFPCLPATLSPSCIFLFSFIYITIEKKSFFFKILMRVTIPLIPLGVFNDTSLIISLRKMVVNNFELIS